MEQQLGNHQNRRRRGEGQKRSRAEEPIRIKYISSPMMVQANNASEFRAIVQKLTGQHSDIAIPDHETNHYEQERWVSNHGASNYEDIKACNGANEIVRLSEDGIAALDQFDEIKFWREVSEGLCGFQSPCTAYV